MLENAIILSAFCRKLRW